MDPVQAARKRLRKEFYDEEFSARLRENKIALGEEVEQDNQPSLNDSD
jgi:hypothetical protein